MALSEIQVPVRFTGGVETKLDPKGVLPAKLIDLQNGVFTKANALVKRRGYTEHTANTLGGGTMGETAWPLGLGKRADELLVFADGKGFSWSPKVSQWTSAGACAPATLSRRTVTSRPGVKQQYPDVAEAGGIRVFVWNESTTLRATVEEVATGRVLVAALGVATAVLSRVRAINGRLVIFYRETVSGDFKTRVINPATPTTLGAATTLVAGTGANFFFDVDASPDCTYAAAGWCDAAADFKISYVDNTGALTVVATTVKAGINITPGVAVSMRRGSATPNIGYAWVEGAGAASDIHASARQSDLTTVVLADTIVASVTVVLPAALAAAWRPSAVDLRVFVGYVNGTTRYVIRAGLSGSGAAATANQYDSVLGSRAYATSGFTHVTIYRTATFWATYYAVRDDGVVVARFLHGQAPRTVGTNWLPDGQLVGSTISSLLLGIAQSTEKTSLSTTSPVYFENWLELVQVDYAPVAPAVVELGASAYVAGAGFLWAYDGSKFVESGAFYAPDDVANPTQAAGAIPDGAYNWVFVYEFQNAQGEWERGPVSVPKRFTVTGGPRQLTFAIPTLRHTQKANVRIGVYRTELNSSAAYYRVSSFDTSTIGGVNGYVTNDLIVDSVVFIDNMLDTALITKEPLYTNGGILENDGYESGGLMAALNGRVFTNDAIDGDAVRFSQERAAGYTLEQPDGLSVQLSRPEGPVTAFSVLDDSLIIFKHNSISYVGGPGPLADGQTGGFTSPLSISSTVGCVDARSVVAIPSGLMFQSERGIFHLGRDRSVQYIGAPVEAYNSQTIVAATLIEDRTQVRFLTSSGRTLVYDYLVDQWSTFTNHTGLSAVVVDGVYYYLHTDGAVRAESAGFQDSSGGSGVDIDLVAETAWIKLAGHSQGFQRVYNVEVLGEYKSSCVVTLKAAYDYENTWVDTWTITSSDFITGAERFQFSVHVGQKCEAVRFYIKVAAAGEGCELAELLVTGGIKRGRWKDSNARTY